MRGVQGVGGVMGTALPVAGSARIEGFVECAVVNAGAADPIVEPQGGEIVWRADSVTRQAVRVHVIPAETWTRPTRHIYPNGDDVECWSARVYATAGDAWIAVVADIEAELVQARQRMIAALLPSPFPAGKRVLRVPAGDVAMSYGRNHPHSQLVMSGCDNGAYMLTTREEADHQQNAVKPAGTWKTSAADAAHTRQWDERIAAWRAAHFI